VLSWVAIDSGGGRVRDEAIVTEGLRRHFGPIKAVDGVDLAAPAGTVLGLLGPNGAGKTTIVRILTTLLDPDGGSARVAGYDVVRDAEALRSVIGLAGQYAAVDENLTGRENLDLVGRLYHLGRSEASRRADEMLERFELTDAASRTVKTYSGGMRRRLDLGASLVGRPQVLFLDEPTTGLDPRSRFGLWDVIRELVNDGTTLLLTTQYLEEADRLADHIAVIDGGRVIAEGTSDELKSRVGGDLLALRVADRARVAEAAAAIADLGSGAPQVVAESGEVSLPVREGASILAEVVRRLDAAGLEISDLALGRPSLDDVFLALTGHVAEAAGEDGEETEPPRGRGRRPARSRA
jgi:ABC-2 type transport system ATP-binding protein